MIYIFKCKESEILRLLRHLSVPFFNTVGFADATQIAEKATWHARCGV